jgi:hypothetical protein
MRILTLLVVLAASAFAGERNVQLANPATQQSLQELATAIRTVGQIKTVNIEAPASFHIEGTPGELDMAEWMLTHFDRPTGWRPNEQELNNPAARTFQNNVRIFYLAADITPQGTQETLTILRTVLDTQMVYNFTPHRALVARGTSPHLEAIEWVLKAMSSGTISEPYKLEDPRFDTVRVFPLAPATSQKQIQETLTRLRMDLRIQKVFTLSSPPTIVVRATAADMDRVAKSLQ